MVKKIAAMFALILLIGGLNGSSLGRTPAHEPGILARAASTGKFRTLINALVAADLIGTLAEDGPFTVFAPSDEAFAKIPSHDLATLLLPENKARLRKILTLHVAPGRLRANAIAARGRVKSLNGAKLTVAENRHGLAINEATVVQADIECGNGIIHVGPDVRADRDSHRLPARHGQDPRAARIDSAPPFFGRRRLRRPAPATPHDPDFQRG